MPDQSQRKVNCAVRCLDESQVREAHEVLKQHPTAAIPYQCKVSGREETVRLLSDDAAQKIAGRLEDFDSVLPVKIMVALSSAELCECDVVTLMAPDSEDEVLGMLARLHQSGLLNKRVIADDAYFKTDTLALPKLFGAKAQAMH